jgi:hypothetical protein
MPDSAVGLFEDASVAEAVTDALRAHGFPAKGIQVVAQPVNLPVDGATSTPGTDFTAALRRDLRSMGASDYESEAYAAGVRRGHVLVFATGSREQADTAAGIMSEYTTVEVEEFAAAAPAMPGIHRGETGPHDLSSKNDRIRAKKDGARLFTW